MADLADLIEMLAPEDRKNLIEVIRPQFDPETLATLAEHVREGVIEQLGAADVARGQQVGDLPIVGFIGLGMRANSIDPLNHSTTLDEIFVPVLDIFGDGDTPAVTTAADRLSAFGGLPGDYTQIILDCDASLSVQACHTFNMGLKGADDRPLETAVRNWITDTAPINGTLSAVPLPAALPLFGSALATLGLVGWRRRRRKAGA